MEVWELTSVTMMQMKDNSQTPSPVASPTTTSQNTPVPNALTEQVYVCMGLASTVSQGQFHNDQFCQDHIN